MKECHEGEPFSDDASSTSHGDSKYRRKRERGQEYNEVMDGTNKYFRSNSMDANTKITSHYLTPQKRLFHRTSEQEITTSNGGLFNEAECDILSRRTSREGDGCVEPGRRVMKDREEDIRDMTAVGNSRDCDFLRDDDGSLSGLDNTSASSSGHKMPLPVKNCWQESMNDDDLSWASVLPRAPVGPHFSVTGSGGQRVYLRLLPTGNANNQKRCKTITTSRLRLLTVPFAELKSFVEEEVKMHNRKFENIKYLK